MGNIWPSFALPDRFFPLGKGPGKPLFPASTEKKKAVWKREQIQVVERYFSFRPFVYLGYLEAVSSSSSLINTENYEIEHLKYLCLNSPVY